jgi:hypothetical protein
MRKGMKLLCIKDYKEFKSGKKYEITYVDNEKSHVMVSIEGKLYPIDIINKKFKIK